MRELLQSPEQAAVKPICCALSNLDGAVPGGSEGAARTGLRKHATNPASLSKKTSSSGVGARPRQLHLPGEAEDGTSPRPSASLTVDLVEVGFRSVTEHKPRRTVDTSWIVSWNGRRTDANGETPRLLNRRSGVTMSASDRSLGGAVGRRFCRSRVSGPRPRRLHLWRRALACCGRADRSVVGDAVASCLGESGTDTVVPRRALRAKRRRQIDRRGGRDWWRHRQSPDG
jgi:hypothetical protein